MRDDELRRLIERADADVGAPPPPPGDLTRRIVRNAARRKARVRGVFSAAAAIVVMAGAGYWSQWADREPMPKASSREAMPSEPALVVNGEDSSLRELNMEIQRLKREAKQQETLVEYTKKLLEQQQRVARLKETPIPDTVANVNREADKAAGAIVAQADRLCRQMDLCATASIKYRRVVELFPNSRWAQVARQRLQEMTNKGDA